MSVKKPTRLQVWLAQATPQERVMLARLAKTSVASLQFAGGGYRGTPGGMNLGPNLARRIDIATEKMARDKLPHIRREELCAACSQCEYAKKCAK